MLDDNKKALLLKMLLESIDIPDYAYERASNRYEDLGAWLSRDESTVKDFDPRIFSQGSFRLGTVVKPLDSTDSYDLDLNCEFRSGITTASHSQKFVKDLLGNELEKYRQARTIKDPLVEKHRCWRLEYQDSINFHTDNVPSIPAGRGAVYITDDRHPHFNSISHNWYMSSPELYAQWFANRCNQSSMTLDAKTQIDKLPLFKRKTILQRVVQLLKRHRNQMFAGNNDLKPASIIITTLAAMSYNGENDIAAALHTVVSNMKHMISPKHPRIPNPTNPQEDFAERWNTQNNTGKTLERNFHFWLEQLEADYVLLMNATDAKYISDQVKRQFAITLDQLTLQDRLGLSELKPSTTQTNKLHLIEDAPKPWSCIE